jgi:hypothetical protein
MNSLLERFLIYSLKHQRPVKVMLMQDDAPRSLNLTVQSMGREGFAYLSAKNRNKPKFLRYEDLLAASYARGDRGEIMP